MTVAEAQPLHRLQGFHPRTVAQEDEAVGTLVDRLMQQLDGLVLVVEREAGNSRFAGARVDVRALCFRNPKDFVSESGFAGASSSQIPEMLVWRDIAANDYAQSVRLSPN